MKAIQNVHCKIARNVRRITRTFVRNVKKVSTCTVINAISHARLKLITVSLVVPPTIGSADCVRMVMRLKMVFASKN